MTELYYFVKPPFSRGDGPKCDRKAEPVFRKSIYLLGPPWRNQPSRKEPPTQSRVSLYTSQHFRKGGLGFAKFGPPPQNKIIQSLPFSGYLAFGPFYSNSKEGLRLSERNPTG